MIISELKDYFTNHALLQGITFYVGIAKTGDDLPYVILVPGDLTTEYTFSTATPTNPARPCIDTLPYDLHCFTRSSDDLGALLDKITNALDNQDVCDGCMNNERKKISWSFSPYNADAVLSYEVIRTANQNTI